MNLFNPLPTPSGLRTCFWDANYIASQPFCITSRLSDKEARLMADYEESRLWDGIDILKKELQLEIEAIGDIETECSAPVDIAVIDVKKAVELYLAGPKKFYFLGHQKQQKRFGACNTQTSGRHLPKIAINRADYLSR